MTDLKLSAETNHVTTFSGNERIRVCDDPGGTPATGYIEIQDLPATKYACYGLLTLESGVAVSTTDQADKTALYWTPYRGNQIALYDGSSAWSVLTFAELSLNISAYTASKPYDIWAYNNSGAVALESTVWTNGTTRATALTPQDGILVKSGATTRRYLGTIYMDAASKCQDTAAKRFVYNYYNRKKRPLSKQETTTSWTTNTAVVRQANASTANQVEVIIGVAEDNIDINVLSSCTGAGYGYVGIGEDVTNAFTTSGYYQGGGGASANEWFVFSAYLYKVPAIGYHYYAWNELTNATNVTFYAGTGANNYRGGIFGSVMA